MLIRTLLCFSILIGCCVCAEAQSTPMPTPDPAFTERSRTVTPRGGELGTPEDEMRARNEIRVAEKEQQENLDRAKEAAQLGTEICEEFSKSKTIASPELKKLERLEKLARKIRSRAGGEDDDEPLDNIPASLEPAVNRLADTSEALYKSVEKTPRQVVSATVIERVNELLEIIRFIRTNAR